MVDFLNGYVIARIFFKKQMKMSNSKHGLFADLLQEALRSQQDLSAVERFSREHLEGEIHTQSRYYKNLIPLSLPKQGEQYGFEVDLDSCTGCKACVTACHVMNGLDEFEVWREVGTLVGGSVELPMAQYVTSACHHCLDPECLNGCPVKAYEKDKVTGIVKHLDDQCIGCQYCVLKCPYDVPKYNERIGIVRKCDMCSDRLSSGEAPACVQACPNKAIRIMVVNKQNVIKKCESGDFLPGAPDPTYTLPTTIYKTQHGLLKNLLPADYHVLRPQPSHLPLVFMLVFTQMSVGIFGVQAILGFFPDYQVGTLAWKVNLIAGFITGVFGIGVSTFHLGRPLLAFRAFLGWRTSWMSREIIAFGAYLASAGALVLLLLLPFQDSILELVNRLHLLTLVLGCLGVFFSAMIYHDTPRPYWALARTGRRFLLTTIGLGISGVFFLRVLSLGFKTSTSNLEILDFPGNYLLPTLMIVGLVNLLDEIGFLFHLRDKRNTIFKKSVHLLLGPLFQIFAARIVCGLVGGVALPLILIMDRGNVQSHGATSFLSFFLVSSFASLLVAELLERKLFFQAVVPPKMPGAIAE